MQQATQFREALRQLRDSKNQTPLPIAYCPFISLRLINELLIKKNKMP